MIWDLICKPFRYDYQSESADKFLFDLPEEVDFPDINITTETETYSISSSPSGDIIQQQYGDNDIIEDEKYYQSDTSIYGY